MKLYKDKFGKVYCGDKLENNLELTNDEILEYYKNIKIQTLKNKNEEIIFKVYPQYKQNNIAIIGTEDEKIKFKNFKNKQVGIYDDLVNQINSCSNIKEIEIINF